MRSQGVRLRAMIGTSGNQMVESGKAGCRQKMAGEVEILYTLWYNDINEQNDTGGGA